VLVYKKNDRKARRMIERAILSSNMEVSRYGMRKTTGP
jgi:hypothetical protein